MNDLRGDDGLRAEELEACRQVLDSGWYVLGEEVARFEARWAGICGVSHAVGVGNGLDAIEIGLRALGIGPGDEVITTGMTAFATVLAVLRAGATPVLADIREEDACLDPQSVARCCGPRSRAVILVHLYGRLGPVAPLLELCRERGIELIEDCAQAHLAQGPEGRAGGFGTCAAWSFYPTKNLGAVGDGGALTTDDPGLAEQARRLRNYGQADRYAHVVAGLNSRLDELQAALLSVRVERLAAWTERRQVIGERYDSALAGSSVRPLTPPVTRSEHVRHLYVVRCERRDALARHLTDSGIQSLVHYPIPAHEQAAGRSLRLDPEGVPVTERHSRLCLSLPCHPGLSDRDVDRVVETVLSWGGA